MNEIFSKKVSNLQKYCEDHNLKSLVIGISGGIDSTLCLLIARQVEGIKLIGLSMPSNTNTSVENQIAKELGEIYCDEFHEIPIDTNWFTSIGEDNKTSNGNLKARIRMMYLYDIANKNNGCVIDTGNLTEHVIGYFTKHGDEGDVCLLHDLTKTQVYECVESCVDYRVYDCVRNSYNQTPTDGNGGGDDLTQIGIDSYGILDNIVLSIVLNEDKYINVAKHMYGDKTFNIVYDLYKKNSHKQGKVNL